MKTGMNVNSVKVEEMDSENEAMNCDICGKVFRSKASYTYHTEKKVCVIRASNLDKGNDIMEIEEDDHNDGNAAEGDEKIGEMELDTETATTPSTFKCEHCGKIFKTESGYAYHTEKRVCIEMRHNPRNARKHTKKSPKNNEQGKDQVLDKASEVKNEELQEEGEGEGKTGNSVERAQVGTHKKEHITKPTSYRCDSCGKVFKTEGGYSYHIEKKVCIEMRHNPRNTGGGTVKKKDKVKKGSREKAISSSRKRESKYDHSSDHDDDDDADDADGCTHVDMRGLQADSRTRRIIDKKSHRHIDIKSFYKNFDASSPPLSSSLDEKFILQGIWSRATICEENVFEFNDMCVLHVWLHHYGICRSKMINRVFRRNSFAFSKKMNDIDYDSDVGVVNPYEAMNIRDGNDGDDDSSYDYLCNVCGCAVTSKFHSTQRGSRLIKFLAIGTLRVGLLDYDEAADAVRSGVKDNNQTDEDEHKKIAEAMAKLNSKKVSPSGYHSSTLGYPSDHKNMFTLGKVVKFPNLLQIWRIPTDAAPYLTYFVGFDQCGPIYHVEWSPHQFPIQVNTDAVDHISILGVLAVVTGEGKCYIIVLPTQVVAKTTPMPENKDFLPVISANEVTRWSLQFPPILENDVSTAPVVTCVAWMNSAKIVCGASSGHIGIFVLRDTNDSENRNSNNGYNQSLYPIIVLTDLLNYDPFLPSFNCVRAVSPCPYNENWIATGGHDGIMKLWDCSSSCFKPVVMKETIQATGGLYNITWEPHGHGIYISGGSHPTVFWEHLWTPLKESRNVLHDHNSRHGAVWDMALYNTHDRGDCSLLSVSSNGSVKSSTLVSNMLTNDGKIIKRGHHRRSTYNVFRSKDLFKVHNVQIHKQGSDDVENADILNLSTFLSYYRDSVDGRPQGDVKSYCEYLISKKEVMMHCCDAFSYYQNDDDYDSDDGGPRSSGDHNFVNRKRPQGNDDGIISLGCYGGGAGLMRIHEAFF